MNSIVHWVMLFGTLVSTSNQLARTKRAGRKQLRVFNGQDAKPGEFPFMAQVLADTEFNSEGVMTQNLCGGSILTPNIILTAAHCVVRDVSGMGWEDAQDQIYHPIHLGVWVGDLDNYESDSQQYGAVKAIIVHEDYDSFRIINDIALVVLEEDLRIDFYSTGLITLPEDEEVDSLYAEGSPVTVIGWGFTEVGHTSSVLQKLSYEMTSREDCEESYGDQLFSGMMCTGVKPMDKHSALGDSGGPLFTKTKDRWVQLGIVSWGAEEQSESTYDVNTNVNYYKRWIASKVNEVSTVYVQEVVAEDSAKTIQFNNLPNFLFKRITIYPKDSKKYTKITITDAYLNPNSFITIYDGTPLADSRMLVQLTGRVSGVIPVVVVGVANRELTLILLTGNQGRSDRIELTYEQVDTPRDQSRQLNLKCSFGYTACPDNFYCLKNTFFCNGVGQCYDGSDEIEEVCDSINNREQNNTLPYWYVKPKSENADDGDKDSSSAGPMTISLLFVTLSTVMCCYMVLLL